MRGLGIILGMLCAVTGAIGQATSPAIQIKIIAEVETKVIEAGHEVVRLAPADRVVPGDQVLYTLEMRNTGPTAVAAPTVTNPIPNHMRYLADSATGPGAQVSYSADGGATFGHPDSLRVALAGGRFRAATPADYTHIRWQLRNTLKSHSVAYARFRAIVK
jgi:uncharacterized repeat protein (TIGR01451 family)